MLLGFKIRSDKLQCPPGDV